jgi:hypothetical protein
VCKVGEAAVKASYALSYLITSHAKPFTEDQVCSELFANELNGFEIINVIRNTAVECVNNSEGSISCIL